MMRGTSQQRGLPTPTIAQLEAMVPDDMRCVGCGRSMVWSREECRSRVMTLQHDRSGLFRFICQGCNTKHASMPGDTFYGLQVGHKFCAGCNQQKPVAEFATDRSRRSGRKARCRACCKVFYDANRSYWQRRARAKRGTLTVERDL
jgi:hypothetical protein